MKGDLRCIDGRLFRHDPQFDDPDLETDVGVCRDCGGAGCDVEESTEEATMTDAILAAQAVLQAECDKLTAALVAKGCPDAHGEIWINWHGREVVARFSSSPHGSFFANDVPGAVAQAMEAIAALPDPNAYDTWFAWAPAEAAE